MNRIKIWKKKLIAGIHSTGNSSMHESSAMKVGGRMVKTFQAYLPDCHRTYSCVHCRAHLANHDELISKVFHCLFAYHCTIPYGGTKQIQLESFHRCWWTRFFFFIFMSSMNRINDCSIVWLFDCSLSKAAKVALTSSILCNYATFEALLLRFCYSEYWWWQCDRVNVGCGPAEERVLLTGLHAVADIFCESCKTTLGWKYASSISFFITFF